MSSFIWFNYFVVSRNETLETGWPVPLPAASLPPDLGRQVVSSAGRVVSEATEIRDAFPS